MFKRLISSAFTIAIPALTVAPAAHATDVNYVDKAAQTSLGAAAVTQCVDNSALMSSTGFATGNIVITGTFSGTVSFFGASDAVPTWNAITVWPQAGGAAVQTATTTGSWFFPVAGYQILCVEFSTYSSGTAVVSQRLSLRERPYLASAGTPFQCSYASTSTTSVQLAGCAIQAGVSYYITGISVSGDTITSATNPATIQAGAGTTCTTPTVLYQAHHLALTTVTWSPPSPIKSAQGAGLCLLDAATGSKYVTVTGYTAP